MDRQDLPELLALERSRSLMPPGWQMPVADPYAAMEREADTYERGADIYERAAQILADRATFYRHAAGRETTPPPAPSMPPLESSDPLQRLQPGGPTPPALLNADMSNPRQVMLADADLYDADAAKARQHAANLRERAKVYRETAARERGRPTESAPTPMGVDPADPLKTGRFSTAAAPPADGAHRDAAVAAGMPS